MPLPLPPVRQVEPSVHLKTSVQQQQPPSSLNLPNIYLRPGTPNYSRVKTYLIKKRPTNINDNIPEPWSETEPALFPENAQNSPEENIFRSTDEQINDDMLLMATNDNDDKDTEDDYVACFSLPSPSPVNALTKMKSFDLPNNETKKEEDAPPDAPRLDIKDDNDVDDKAFIETKVENVSSLNVEEVEEEEINAIENEQKQIELKEENNQLIENDDSDISVDSNSHQLVEQVKFVESQDELSIDNLSIDKHSVDFSSRYVVGVPSTLLEVENCEQVNNFMRVKEDDLKNEEKVSSSSMNEHVLLIHKDNENYNQNNDQEENNENEKVNVEENVKSLKTIEQDLKVDEVTVEDNVEDDDNVVAGDNASVASEVSIEYNAVDFANRYVISGNTFNEHNESALKQTEEFKSPAPSVKANVSEEIKVVVVAPNIEKDIQVQPIDQEDNVEEYDLDDNVSVSSEVSVESAAIDFANRYLVASTSFRDEDNLNRTITPLPATGDELLIQNISPKSKPESIREEEGSSNPFAPIENEMDQLIKDLDLKASSSMIPDSEDKYYVEQIEETIVEPFVTEKPTPVEEAAPVEPPPVEEAAVEPAPVEEAASVEPAPVEEVAPVEPPPVEEAASVEPAPGEEAAVEPAPLEEAAVEPPQVEEAAVEPAPLEEAVVEPAPVEPPVEEAVVEPNEPVEEAAVEPPPVEEAAVEPSQVEEAAVEPPQVEEAAVEPPQVEEAAVEPPQVEEAAVEPPQVEEAAVEPPQVEEAAVGVEPVEEAAVNSQMNETGEIEAWKSFENSGSHDEEFAASPQAVKLKAELAASHSTAEMLKQQTKEQNEMIQSLIGAKRLEEKLEAATHEVEVYKMTTTAQAQTIEALMAEIRALKGVTN